MNNQNQHPNPDGNVGDGGDNGVEQEMEDEWQLDPDYGEAVVEFEENFEKRRGNEGPKAIWPSVGTSSNRIAGSLQRSWSSRSKQSGPTLAEGLIIIGVGEAVEDKIVVDVGKAVKAKIVVDVGDEAKPEVVFNPHLVASVVLRASLYIKARTEVSVNVDSPEEVDTLEDEASSKVAAKLTFRNAMRTRSIEYDVHPGAQAINLAIEVDRKRIYFSDYQQESSSKEARTERLKRLHGPNDDSYIPGGH
ncbi:hypothetical protein TKK_0012432 [Trichogramma kaykai]